MIGETVNGYKKKLKTGETREILNGYDLRILGKKRGTMTKRTKGKRRSGRAYKTIT